MANEQPTLHGYPVKIGDRVWHFRFGWGRVKRILEDDEHPILVGDFDRHPRYVCWFSERGEPYYIDNPAVELFWQSFDPPEHAFQKSAPEIDWSKVPQGTPVEVRSSLSEGWEKARFVAYLPEYVFPHEGNFRWVVSHDDARFVAKVYPQCRLAPDVEVKDEWLE